MKTEEAVRRVYISHGPRDKDLARDMARRVRLAGMQPMAEIDSPRPRKKEHLAGTDPRADAVLMLVTPRPWSRRNHLAWVWQKGSRRSSFLLPSVLSRSASEPLQTYQALPYDRLDEAIATLMERPGGSR
jgi:hypothetical protein